MTIPGLPSSISISALTDPLFEQKKIRVSMARLDLVHDIVSGNKLFKLWYNLKNAKESGNPVIVSYGGAWSNHLVATAYAARSAGLGSRGIVRGEKQSPITNTLEDCLQYGMELEFVSRSTYKEIHYTEGLTGSEFHIPEGGFSNTGARGAALICDLLPESDFYCLAAGSATTTSGLCLGFTHKNIICVPAIKNMTDLEERVDHLVPGQQNALFVDNRFHFGGFAKYDKDLLEFMNYFYAMHKIKLDIVYTGKLMFTVYDIIRSGGIPEGSSVICIHTGGLQGNRSVVKGLDYL